MNNKTHRIAIFLPSLSGGGAERIMVNLANEISQRGLHVDLVLSKAKGPYLSLVHSDVRIVNLDSNRVLSSIPSLVRYLRKKRPLSLLSTLDHANIAALWSKRLARVDTRIIIRQANSISLSAQNKRYWKEKYSLPLARLFYPWADGIIAVSQGVAYDLSHALRISPNAIRTIYNPVITPDLLAKSKGSLNHPWFQPGEPPVILGVGRLSAQKDFSALIKAFQRVRSKRFVRLLILGEGEERRQLESMVRKFGLTKDVSMPGFVENPFVYMRKASVFVLSSIWEGLPGALIQAMACGCPVISTSCPWGPAEILEDGKYGTLVPVNDVPKLAAAIEEVLDKSSEPSGNILSRANDFSCQKITDQYLNYLV